MSSINQNKNCVLVTGFKAENESICSGGWESEDRDVIINNVHSKGFSVLFCVRLIKQHMTRFDFFYFFRLVIAGVT